MRKIKFILLSFISIFQNSLAQTPPYLVRAKCYGGSLDDIGVTTNISPNISYTPDNFVLLTGGSNSSDGDLSNNKGNSDIILIKTDTSGNVIWGKNYGGTGGDAGCNTYILPDSNYLITAGSSSTNGDATGAGFHGTIDVLVLKINHIDGSVIWTKYFGGSDDESPHCAVVDNNSITIACRTRSFDGDITNKTGPISNHDIWVFKIDLNGNLIWQKVFNGTEWDFPFEIIKSNGNYFIIGSTLSTDKDFTDNHGKLDSWLAKLDNSGILVWKKCVGGTEDDYPATLIKLINGNFLALINTTSKNGDATGAPNLQKSKMFYIFKDDGTMVDVKFFGSDINADGVDIIQREDTSFLLTQFSYNDSVRISFMDTNYIILNRISYGTNSITVAPAFRCIKAPGDYLFLIKQTKGKTGQIVGNHGGYDYWVLKVKLAPVKVYPKQPSKPINLQCININTSIKLSWLDSDTSNRSVWIYRSTNDSLNYIIIDSVLPIIHQYTDAAVVNAKRYYYKVAGANSQGKLFSNYCDSRLNVGIKSSSENQFKVFPNPFTEALNITCNQDKLILNVEVFNQMGQVITINKGINKQTVHFDTRDWVKGVYYIKVNFVDSTSYQLFVTKK